MVNARLRLFREYIDAVMAATGWGTPTEVARRSGIAASTVNRPYAKDDIAYLPGLRTIDAIARASHVAPPAGLIGGIVSETPGRNGMDHASRTLLRSLLDLYDPLTIIREVGVLADESRSPKEGPQKRA